MPVHESRNGVRYPKVLSLECRGFWHSAWVQFRLLMCDFVTDPEPWYLNTAANLIWFESRYSYPVIGKADSMRMQPAHVVTNSRKSPALVGMTWKSVSHGNELA